MTSEAEGARVDLQARARVEKLVDDWTGGYGPCPHGPKTRVCECEQCLADLIVALAADEARREREECIKIIKDGAARGEGFYFRKHIEAIRNRGASQPQPVQPETRGEEWRQRKYAKALPIVRAVARRHGYAIGVHGSETRDLDLIAAPWAEEASTAAELAQQIMLAVDGVIVNDETADPNDYTRRNPQPKPHGRLGWSIQLGGGAYIDLSVLPKTGCAFPGVPGPAKEARVSPAEREVMLNDLGQLLEALGWANTAMPISPHAVMLKCIEEVKRLRARVSRSTDSEPEPARMRYCRSCKVCARHCQCDAPSHVPVGECQRRADGTPCDESCFICCRAAEPPSPPPSKESR